MTDGRWSNGVVERMIQEVTGDVRCLGITLRAPTAVLLAWSLSSDLGLGG